MKTNNKQLLDLLADSDEEKQKKKLAQKRQRLRSLLTIPLEERNEEHLREIARLLKVLSHRSRFRLFSKFIRRCLFTLLMQTILIF